MFSRLCFLGSDWALVPGHTLCSVSLAGCFDVSFCFPADSIDQSAVWLIADLKCFRQIDGKLEETTVCSQTCFLFSVLYHLITVLLPLLVNCLLCLYKYIALIADYRNIKHILCLYGTSWIQTWILHRSIAPQHIVKSGSYITHGHDGSEGLQPVLNASWFLFLLSL